jgi:hypothetical protein
MALYLRKEMMYHPPSLFSLTTSSGLEWEEFNLACEEHTDHTLKISAT